MSIATPIYIQPYHCTVPGLKPSEKGMRRCLPVVALLTMLVAEPLPEWAQALSQKGWTIQEGEMGIFDVDTCSHADTCYALNPLTP
jgi:hypothetical protein